MRELRDGEALRSGAPHAAVLPPGGAPGGGVEAVAAVDDDASGDEGCRVVGRQLATVFVPFGDDDDGVGAVKVSCQI